MYTLGEDEVTAMPSNTPQAITRLKKRYLRIAIAEYEYSPAPEYVKRRMSRRAVSQGTVDLDPSDAESDVAISPDGAWVTARVWIPKEWLKTAAPY